MKAPEKGLTSTALRSGSGFGIAMTFSTIEFSSAHALFSSVSSTDSANPVSK